MQVELIKENAAKKKFKKTFEVTFDSQKEIDFLVAQMALYYGFTDTLADTHMWEVMSAIGRLTKFFATEKGTKKYSDLLDSNFHEWITKQIQELKEGI